MKPVWHGARVTTPLNQSLNLAVNIVPNTPEFSATQILTITMFTAIALAIIYKKKVSKNDEFRVYALMSIDFPFEQ
jgi:hypothetical protein